MAKQKQNGALPIDDLMHTLRLEDAAVTAEILAIEREQQPGSYAKAAEPLYRRRREIWAEIEKAQQRWLEDHSNLAALLYAEHKDTWRQLQTQRAHMLIGLRRINASIEALRVTLSSAGQRAPLPLDGWTHRLFGTSNKEPGRVGAMADHFLLEAVKEGVIQQKEIDQ